jgi:hypothetical protein
MQLMPSVVKKPSKAPLWYSLCMAVQEWPMSGVDRLVKWYGATDPPWPSGCEYPAGTPNGPANGANP